MGILFTYHLAENVKKHQEGSETLNGLQWKTIFRTTSTDIFIFQVHEKPGQVASFNNPAREMKRIYCFPASDLCFSNFLFDGWWHQNIVIELLDQITASSFRGFRDDSFPQDTT
jgi:hypothetical protein